jgi:hypothetical protein
LLDPFARADSIVVEGSGVSKALSVLPRQEVWWLEQVTTRWSKGDPTLARKMVDQITAKALEGLSTAPTYLEVAHAVDWASWWFVVQLRKIHALNDTVSTLRLDRDLREWRKAGVALGRIQRLQARLPFLQVNIAANQQFNNGL